MEVKTANLALRMNWSLAPLAPRSARRWPGALGFALLALGTGWSAPVAPPPSLPPPAARVVDFARDVRPLLEQHCGKCHGAEKQRGDLRLDQKTAALKGGESGAVILPGRSAESLLILAVAGLDPEKVMPQKGERLTTEEVGVLRRWIDDGAHWPDDAAGDPRSRHWSFQPLKKPVVPGGSAKNHSNVPHPIDAFISSRLAEKQLALSPPAEARTLIRRMYFDVIGLPPTPEEVTAFARDFQRQPRRAVAALADKLLASPHYGERWARHWLDVVRFAESDGFETNQPRPNAWPYRDYVIRALNEDKPYDQFVREQLAGDTLGVDEATGFLVGGPWDRVKSPDPVLTANQRADELHDMVGVTGATFLALTVNCARCHNHKFDPIAQTDYYALKAVFAGVQHGERAVRPPDFAARQERAAALRPPLADVEQQLAQFEPLANLAPAPDAPRRAPVTRGRNVERFALVEAKFMRFTIHETTQLEPCLDELEVFTRDGRNVALAAAGARLASSGDYAGNPFHKLEHLHDGLYGNERSWISNERGRGWVRVEFARAEEIERVVWSRDREEVPRYNDRLATRYDVEVSSDGAAWQRVASSADRLPPGTKAGAEHTAKGLAAAEAARFTALLAERSALQTQIAGTIRPQMVYAGKLGPPEKTFRFHRGDPMQPRELAPPGGLSEFPAPWRLGETAADAERRLALAQWIAAPENPLTARVLVNRLWHYHFGNGLVDTPSDFGLNGGRPSHPELLDWLAGEFIARGWSLKAMHRLILTSATYRQSSAPVAAALAVDAGDRLLWRFPPRRLEAEPLRDAILAVSGRLDLRQGGPGFDLFETNANYVKVYVTKTQFGPDDFRRMVYQNKPRAELDALFGAFDCPDAGQIQPRRTVSTTPLQALNLLNSEFLLEQARALAERLAREAGAAPAAQVRRAFALCFSREPHAEETAAATRLIAAHGLEIFCRALYNANEFILVF